MCMKQCMILDTMHCKSDELSIGMNKPCFKLWISFALSITTAGERTFAVTLT